MGQGMGTGMGQMRPAMGAMPAMGMQQPMMFGNMGAVPGARMPQQQPPSQNTQNDPFGALWGTHRSVCVGVCVHTHMRACVCVFMRLEVFMYTL